MLGGGNPVGGSHKTCIGSSINYIGKHAYASSGIITVDNNETNLLKFAVASE